MIQYVTRGNSTPNGKSRVYFTCHPDDFDKYFQKVCDDIFKSHNPAIFYTPDMTAEFEEKNLDADLGRSNLFVIPVTYQLLTTKNRTMDHDVRYAIKKHIPILPLMMESGIDTLYSHPEKFSELQYLDPFTTDHTRISYEEKLKKFLDAVLISDEVAKRVRSAFDAYIFLSYRKKDRAYANKLINLIHNHPEWRDIAVWFDEFLSPGESFQENIEKILENSKLFALLVTPNLLEEPDGKPNFVMAKEYPAAVASGKKILPTEMEETDQEELSKKFHDIPPCVKPETEFETLKELMAEALTLAAKRDNNNDPEHNFLIGLAYLEGIDVEVNKERGIQLIAPAAYAKLPEALLKLRDMYREEIVPGYYSFNADIWGQRTYEYYKEAYGEVHPDTLNSLNVYADICREIGQTEKAFKLSEEAYTHCCDILGETHPETLIALNTYAMASDTVLDFEKAQELCKLAYTLCKKHLGEENSVASTAAHNYATVYYNHKKYRKAVPLFEKVYRLRLVTLGDEHHNTLQSLDTLADTYTKIRKHKKALELRVKEYPLYCKILGETHPDTLEKLHNLAGCYVKAGKKAKALETYQKVYGLRVQCLGEEDHDTLSSLAKLADVYGRLGKFGECFKLWLKHDLAYKPLWDYNIIRAFDYSALEQQDRDTMKELLALADSYEARGEKELVLDTYNKIRAYSRKVLGDGSALTQNTLHILFVLCWRYRKFGRMIKYYAISYRNNFKMLSESLKSIEKK
ncbi:MAG: toll/interleukin-1 receptor domain-containing protein [Clostridia bacterium]|nr:toll/interleukin-1 receptor domain-containing protein [Clostridia bacterium]